MLRSRRRICEVYAVPLSVLWWFNTYHVFPVLDVQTFVIVATNLELSRQGYIPGLVITKSCRNRTLKPFILL